MQVQVKKWGNSQGIRIPKECMLDAGIDINELLNISASDGVITLIIPEPHRNIQTASSL